MSMVTLNHEQMSDPMEMLKATILLDVEEKLAQHEEALWVKGQAELRKLQQEHRQLQSSMNELRTEQDRLRSENRNMQEAVDALALSCEVVVKQLHLALRVLPREPLCTGSPSAVSTMASEDGNREVSDDALSTPKREVEACSSAMFSPTNLPSMRQESDCAPMRLSDTDLADALTAASASASSTPSRSSAVFVRLSKEAGFTTLGIDVKQLKNETLRVKSVDPHGSVGQHNIKQASDTSKIMVGDCIATVNGVEGDSDAMLAVCKQSSILEFVLHRTGDDAFDASDNNLRMRLCG
jgi:FtsZ-binding cell division protein ZapB